MKKGVMLTLSIVLMASAFLYLLTAISAYSNSMKESTSAVSDFERLGAQFDSADYGIKSILSANGMAVTNEGTWISFEADLNEEGGLKNYSAALYQFKLFMENFGAVNTSLDTSEAEKPKMYIYPQDIEVEYFLGKVRFDPENSPESEGDIDGYEVLITLDEPVPTLHWEELSEVPQNDSDAVYFHIGVQGNDGGMGDTRYLGRYNSSEVRLLDGQNRSIVNIQIGPPAKVTINYNVDMHLKTIVRLNSSSSVELGTDMLTADMGPGGKKIGKVILNEGR